MKKQTLTALGKELTPELKTRLNWVSKDEDKITLTIMSEFPSNKSKKISRGEIQDYEEIIEKVITDGRYVSKILAECF